MESNREILPGLALRCPVWLRCARPASISSGTIQMQFGCSCGAELLHALDVSRF